MLMRRADFSRYFQIKPGNDHGLALWSLPSIRWRITNRCHYLPVLTV